jgi:hypothetical protein
MNTHTRFATAALCIVLGVCGPGIASAQTSFGTQSPAFPVDAATVDPGTDAAKLRTPPTASAAVPPPASGDMKISVYPILLWVPAFSATTNVPPFPDVPDGPDLPGGSGSTSASFDGAALAGVSIEKARWRIDADGIWAALGTTRDRPLLNVDLDIIYGHVSGGVKVYKDLYVTGGVRRLALKYDIQLEDRPRHFVRKPGIWDPLVGLGWHGALGSRWTLHVVGEGGGFGAGADVDLSGVVRADVEVAGHVGLTFGYTVLYLKLSDTVLQRTFEVKQTLQGPVVGLGLYF